MSVGVTSGTYCKCKYPTVTVTSALTYILLPTGTQELFTYPVACHHALIKIIKHYCVHSRYIRYSYLRLFVLEGGCIVSIMTRLQAAQSVVQIVAGIFNFSVF
jgi:hypothetical protein